MIRHCLIPRRIVGQLGYVQTKLLRDESGEIMGYCSPVLYQLRKGDARVPQERELQRHAQLVPSLPSRADDLDIGRLEGIEPGQMVAIGWDGEDLIAFALGQELMLALRHAVSCPQKVRSEEHTSELQSLMRISYAVFCLKKKKQHNHKHKLL